MLTFSFSSLPPISLGNLNLPGRAVSGSSASCNGHENRWMGTIEIWVHSSTGSALPSARKWSLSTSGEVFLQCKGTCRSSICCHLSIPVASTCGWLSRIRSVWCTGLWAAVPYPALAVQDLVAELQEGLLQSFTFRKWCCTLKIGRHPLPDLVFILPIFL